MHGGAAGHEYAALGKVFWSGRHTASPATLARVAPMEQAVVTRIAGSLSVPSATAMRLSESFLRARGDLPVHRELGRQTRIFSLSSCYIRWLSLASDAVQVNYAGAVGRNGGMGTGPGEIPPEESAPAPGPVDLDPCTLVF